MGTREVSWAGGWDVKDQRERSLRNSMKKTEVREQDPKAGVVEGMGTGRGYGTHGVWGRRRSVGSGLDGAGSAGALPLS